MVTILLTAMFVLIGMIRPRIIYRSDSQMNQEHMQLLTYYYTAGSTIRMSSYRPLPVGHLLAVFCRWLV